MIVTENIFSTISQLIKPLLGVFLTGLLSVIIRLYDNYHDKNTHIKFLRINFPAVKSFIENIQIIKLSTILLSFSFFVGGILIGVVIELILAIGFEQIYINILHIEHLQNLLYPIHSAQNLASLKLNLQIVFSSCLNIISFLFLTLIYIRLYKIIKSRNLLTPLLVEGPSLKSSVMPVYMSYSAFIGIPVGLLLLLYTMLFSNLQESPLINGNFSFTSIYLSGTIETLKTNVSYPEIHFLIHLFAFVTCVFIIIDSYYNITNISNKVIKAITNFYICDFPDIKITTNHGETKGKLKDIKNKSFVTLSENNVLKTVKWNKIEIMEIKNRNKNEQFIFDYSYEKDKQ